MGVPPFEFEIKSSSFLFIDSVGQFLKQKGRESLKVDGWDRSTANSSP